MSDTFTVQRSTSVQAPASSIYPHLVDFRKWTAWSPWEQLDPNMQRTYSGSDAGAGAKYAWKGNRKAGQGTMEITDATEPNQVSIALAFLKPFKSSNTTTFDLGEAGNETEVTWTMTGPATLTTKLMGFFKSMDKLVGPDFEKGLARLKTVAERPKS